MQTAAKLSGDLGFAVGDMMIEHPINAIISKIAERFQHITYSYILFISII
ncbi:hypothetical protein ACTXGL_08675 [Psychrobacter sp. T6-6]